MLPQWIYCRACDTYHPERDVESRCVARGDRDQPSTYLRVCPTCGECSDDVHPVDRLPECPDCDLPLDECEC